MYTQESKVYEYNRKTFQTSSAYLKDDIKNLLYLYLK